MHNTRIDHRKVAIIMHWKAHVEALQEFINNPSATARVSAQWRLEAIEDVLARIEEKERREQEALDQWCEQQQAEMLMQHEQHAHVNGMCD
jgi:hypothetical protein